MPVLRAEALHPFETPPFLSDDALLSLGHEACLEWILEPSHISIAEIRNQPGGGAFLSDRTEMPYEEYRESGFPTPSGKMDLASSILKQAGFDPLPAYKEPALSPVSAPAISRDFPLILTTGARLPMFMHSRMYRIPSMRQLRPNPMVDFNPRGADDRGEKPSE
jgi:anaerobic selenocysteine-containing dehydrogenase